MDSGPDRPACTWVTAQARGARMWRRAQWAAVRLRVTGHGAQGEFTVPAPLLDLSHELPPVQHPHPHPGRAAGGGTGAAVIPFPSPFARPPDDKPGNGPGVGLDDDAI